MNELQKEYFEKVEKEQAEAEAAEEARLKAVMEAERKKEAVKQEAEKKAKEEAERKAEAEAIEIINRVKAEMAANKKKEAEDQSETKDQQVEQPEQKGSETEDSKKDETEKKEPAKTEPKEEETDIYEREPVGEASMPKKSPKFKKGGRKSTAGKVPQRPQPQEAAATEESETAKAQPKESKEEVPDMKQKEAGKPKKEQTKPESKSGEKAKPETNAQKKPEAEATEEEAVEKATPESKAAADREAKLQEVADEYQDKYKRLLAEFENARAREAKEASRMYDVGAKAVLEKLLPVVDNFERAIQTIPEEDKDRAFEQGVDKIYKQMMTILGDIGVEPMNAEGTEFNPDLHNAVMHVEDESLGENVVAEEMQKGYMYKDSVLRYSMVKVAN